MKTATENGGVVLFFEGRIDSSNAETWERAIRTALEAHPGCTPILDFGGLDYISSAGLRVLMKLSKQAGEKLTVREVSPEVYEILDMTGFTVLLDVRKRLRKIDVEGCEVIGRGAYGTVYRIDADTIVKVYETPNAVNMIRNEQKMAKYAFLKGIPTAISYDIVRVGEHYGSVFELVKARTFNDLLVREPERADTLMRQYAEVIRRVHAVTAEAGELRDARRMFLQYLDEVVSVLPEAEAAKLRALLAAMPENLHLIHGDIHMKNVMLSDGEPLLIDMDTLSVGDPVFDFAGLINAYELFEEDEPGNTMQFMGIPPELGRTVWRKVLEHYLDSPDAAALRSAEDKVRLAGSLRFLDLVYAQRVGDPALRSIRAEHTVRNMTELLARVDDLSLTPRRDEAAV